MRHNKSYSFFSRLVILFVVVVLFGWGIWAWWKDSISPVDPNDINSITFTVNTGDSVKMIASNLAAEKIIRSPTGFYLLIKALGIERKIQAGEFRLRKNMDSKAIALELTHGISDIWVTVPEGLRSEEIATKISNDLEIPEAEFLRVVEEGYMFPDTYLVPKDATPAGIAKMFRDNFEKKLTDSMRRDSKKTGLSMTEIITLASIVEREGRNATDRPIIAGILLRRLKEEWPLQVDATLQYALGYQAYEKTWWKKHLTLEDLKIDSPYNTYKNTGLPPGPICNPGLESIQAVIYSRPSAYYFYLHDEAGGVHYAKTIEEHEANIRSYLR